MEDDERGPLPAVDDRGDDNLEVASVWPLDDQASRLAFITAGPQRLDDLRGGHYPDEWAADHLMVGAVEELPCRSICEGDRALRVESHDGVRAAIECSAHAVAVPGSRRYELVQHTRHVIERVSQIADLGARPRFDALA